MAESRLSSSKTTAYPMRSGFSQRQMYLSRFPPPAREASGTGNMKFMLNGALTLGTMDGANVEIVEEVGKENAFIFGLSAEQVIQYENYGGYNPMDIFNNDQDIRRVLMQLINGTYSPQDSELFRPLYNSPVKYAGHCEGRYLLHSGGLQVLCRSTAPRRSSL